MSAALGEVDLSRDGEVLPWVLEEHARLAPESPFLHYGEDGTTLNYRQGAELIGSIAAGLLRHGVQKGDRVCVYLRNPLVTTLAMFAIWRAGAVFAPINPAFRGELLRYQISDTIPRALITEGSLVEDLRAVVRDGVADATIFVHAASTLEDAEVDFDDLRADATPPSVELDWADCANVFYTSGTTGAPKGVALSHRWMNQYTWPFRQLTSSSDVVYSDLPMFHVAAAIFSVARAAWVGASVTLWDRFSVSAFWDRIDTSRATQAIWVDVMTTRLTKLPPRPDDALHTLDKMFLSPLPMNHQEIARRYNFSWYVAGFGQTETGMPLFGLVDEDTAPRPACRLAQGLDRDAVRERATSLGLTIVRGEDLTRKGFLGKPLPYFSTRVVDENELDVPDGAPGQLLVEPHLPGLVLDEYIGKPAETAELTKGGWVRTGDLCLRDDDGVFYYIDRLGDRIRVRGENFASTQVEEVINACDAVSVSAAFAVPNEEDLEDALAVACVPAEGHELSVEVVVAWSKARLPKHMVPSHILILDDLPRTPNNKIRKVELRKMFSTQNGRE